jgi:hypothetical protein
MVSNYAMPPQIRFLLLYRCDYAGAVLWFVMTPANSLSWHPASHCSALVEFRGIRHNYCSYTHRARPASILWNRRTKGDQVVRCSTRT